MSKMDHFQLMSTYNIRMNRQVYHAALSLPQALREQDMGAFFKSISGTLNHILVGDVIWFSRFAKHSENYLSLGKLSQIVQPKALDTIISSNLDELYEMRQAVDELIHHWLHAELKEEDLEKGLHYTNSKGILGHKPFAELLSHVFNHQTHHRGQVSTLLSQQGVDIGVTDFLIDIPNLNY